MPACDDRRSRRAPRVRASFLLVVSVAFGLLLLAACADEAAVDDRPDDSDPVPAATPPATVEDDTETDDTGTSDADPQVAERMEGDAPAFGEERETGVLTAATGIEAPDRVAVAADGTRIVVTEAGRILQHDADGMSSLGRLADGATLRGLAVPPDYPGTPHVYMLLERGERLQVHRFALDGGALVGDEVLAETVADDLSWEANGIAVGSDGAVYAAIGDRTDVVLDLRALVSGDVADPPCSPSAPAGTDELGPWVVVEGTADADARHVGAPLWTVDGARSVAVYRDERIPQWWGNLFVVTDDGDLTRVPADEDGCLDFEEAEVLYEGDYGRFLDVAPGADGDLYLLTGNGTAGTHPDDDRVLRVGPVDDLDLLFPDLRTQPPANLSLEQAWVDDAQRPVLRFTNTVMNLGQGPLEVRDHGRDRAIQRIYASDGSYLERPAGLLTTHWSHAHFHFEDLNRFELWERDAYERMIEGDEEAEPAWFEDKVSMCLMDLVPVIDDPEPGAYGSECVRGAQGISVGWGDVYFFDIDEQWIIVDGDLQDGEYVLRSIVDSENLLHESPGGQDADRESHEANGAATWFTIAGGQISVTHRESGAGEAWAQQ